MGGTYGGGGEGSRSGTSPLQLEPCHSIAGGAGDGFEAGEGFAVFVERLGGQDAGAALKFGADMGDEVVDLGAAGLERAFRDLEPAGGGVGVAEASAGKFLPATDGDPAGGVVGQAGFEGGFPGAFGGEAGGEREPAGDFAIDHDLDGLDGARTGDGAADAVGVDPGAKHRAGRHEAVAAVESGHPAGVGEAVGEMDINAAEAEGDGVDAAGGAGAGAEAEAGIEEGVIGVEGEAGPVPFVAVMGVGEIHPRGGGGGPVGEAEFGAPVVIVGEGEEVDVEEGHEGDGPRPVVLVEIEQGAFATGAFGHGTDRRDTEVEFGVVTEDEEGAEGVGPPSDGEDFVLGVAGPEHAVIREADQSGSGARIGILVAAGGRGEGVGDPVSEREGDVEVLGGHHVGEFVHRAMDMGVAREPAQGCHVDPAPEGDLEGDGFRAEVEGLGDRMVLLAAFDGEGVAARWEVDPERMGGERGVVLDGVGVDPVPAFVAEGGTFGNCGSGEMPASVGSLEVEA